jgi:hypothetical protein
MKKLLLFFLLCVFFSCTEKKVGCIDKDALNYDPTATVMKDSSCLILSIHEWDLVEGVINSLKYSDFRKIQDSFPLLRIQEYPCWKFRECTQAFCNHGYTLPNSIFYIDQKRINDFRIDFIYKFPKIEINKIEKYSYSSDFDDKYYNSRTIIKIDTISVYSTKSEIRIVKLPPQENVEMILTYSDGDSITKTFNIKGWKGYDEYNYLINPKSFFSYELTHLGYHIEGYEIKNSWMFGFGRKEILSGLIIELGTSFEPEFLFTEAPPENITIKDLGVSSAKEYGEFRSHIKRR